MADKTPEGIDRRTFVKQAGVAALAVGMDARSYARIDVFSRVVHHHAI